MGGQTQGNLPGACPPQEAVPLFILVFATPIRPKCTLTHSCPPSLEAFTPCMLTDHSFVILATDVYRQGAWVFWQSLSSHRTTGTLVVLLPPQVSDLRTVRWKVSNKVIVRNLVSAMLIWPFQKVPRSLHFTDGSPLITESVSSWMLVHWCYPILIAIWQERIFCSPGFQVTDYFYSGLCIFQSPLEMHNVLLQ